MHETLNIDKKTNYTVCFVIYEMDLLRLISPWLDNNCRIKTKSATIPKNFSPPQLNKALVSLSHFACKPNHVQHLLCFSITCQTMSFCKYQLHGNNFVFKFEVNAFC